MLSWCLRTGCGLSLDQSPAGQDHCRPLPTGISPLLLLLLFLLLSSPSPSSLLRFCPPLTQQSRLCPRLCAGADEDPKPGPGSCAELVAVTLHLQRGHLSVCLSVPLGWLKGRAESPPHCTKSCPPWVWGHSLAFSGVLHPKLTPEGPPRVPPERGHQQSIPEAGCPSGSPRGGSRGAATAPHPSNLCGLGEGGGKGETKTTTDTECI